MTSNKHNFEELDAPAVAAEKLGISVATLRKYSLIVEKVTGNSQYYDRTKQRARLYHKKDLDDLAAFRKLAKSSKLTLKETARQIYAVSKQQPQAAKNIAKKTNTVDFLQMGKLLNALQQTIMNQNHAITSLQKQLDRIEQQNQILLKQKKKIVKNKQEQPIAPKIASLPDISGIVTKNYQTKSVTSEKKRQQINQDTHKSREEVRNEILHKAKENAKKQSNANLHRTLADMQLPSKKSHWWQRFFNY